MWLVNGNLGFASEEDLLYHLKTNKEEVHEIRWVEILTRPAPASDTAADILIPNPNAPKHRFLEPLGRSGETE